MSNELTSDISKWFDKKLWKSDAPVVNGVGAIGLRQMTTRFLTANADDEADEEAPSGAPPDAEAIVETCKTEISIQIQFCKAVFCLPFYLLICKK